MFDFLKRRKHAAIVAEPFPEGWRGIVDRGLRTMSLDDRVRAAVESRIRADFAAVGA